VALLRDRVRIGHERDVHVCVPERLGNRDHVHAARQQIACERMAIVERRDAYTEARP